VNSAAILPYERIRSFKFSLPRLRVSQRMDTAPSLRLSNAYFFRSSSSTSLSAFSFVMFRNTLRTLPQQAHNGEKGNIVANPFLYGEISCPRTDSSAVTLGNAFAHLGTTSSPSSLAARNASLHLLAQRHHLQPAVRPAWRRSLPREAVKSRNLSDTTAAADSCRQIGITLCRKWRSEGYCWLRCTAAREALTHQRRSDFRCLRGGLRRSRCA
jgi:hypothetical protein